ncbi:hypothetical protein AB0M02_24260 [Actinoplanes sp. NPDC051861]|uniref:hypothetical protein n=1 Tax=Actinoplanes sp. NPDC051861 TaxID=3155170 RepID=UPI0034235277
MRRKETRVERVGSGDHDRDEPPVLRIAGYVTGNDPSPSPAPSPEPGVKLPNISDYWPDSPQRIRAEREKAAQEPGWQVLLPPSAHRRTVPRGAGPVTTSDRPWLRRPVLLTGLLALVIVGGTILLTQRTMEQPQATFPQAPPPAPSVAPPPDPASVAPSTTAPSSAAPTTTPPPTTKPTTAPAEPALPERARFELADGVTELSVRITDLDDRAFQVTTPADSGLDVDTTFRNGVLRVETESSGDGSGELDVLLNADVVWHVQLNAGVRLGTFDLDGGSVSRLDLDGGAERFDVSLGRLSQTLPIRMTGGVNRWRIETAERVPVKINVGRGAGNIIVYGRENGGTGGGETIRNGDLDDAAGLDIDAAAGIGELTIAED